MKETFSPFDAAEFLDNEETIVAYLSAAVEDPNPNVFISALGDVAKARAIANKALMPGAQPRYETIRKLVDALGIKLMVMMDKNFISHSTTYSRSNHWPNSKAVRGGLSANVGESHL